MFFMILKYNYLYIFNPLPYLINNFKLSLFIVVFLEGGEIFAHIGSGLYIY